MKISEGFLPESYVVPCMKSLSLCLKELVSKGYDNDFLIDEHGLQCVKTNVIYQPDEISVVNFLDSKVNLIRAIVRFYM